MLSAPDPYPAVSTQNPAPDDAQIERKTPQICVDYLSHEWKDEDVWNSWKAMTKRKYEIANGVRLENASWRTWAKQRGKLKTISPETLNWWVATSHKQLIHRLKESDVTWLYGPLHGDAGPVPPPKVATTAERLGIDDTPSGKKSILKHRTLSQMLQTPVSVSPPPGEADPASPPSPIHHTVEHAAPLYTVRSETSLADVHKDSRTSSVNAAASQDTDVEEEEPQKGSKRDRHISFNQQVEQCVAVDHEDSSYSYLDNDDEDDEFGRDQEDDEEDEVEEDDEDDSVHKEEPAVMLTVQKQPQRAAFHVSSSQPTTIAMLAPTELKTPHEYSLSGPLGPGAFGDPDDDLYGEMDARYSVAADPVPVTQDLPLDHDGYDYYVSDEEFDIRDPSSYVQSVSHDAGNYAQWRSLPTDADTLDVNRYANTGALYATTADMPSFDLDTSPPAQSYTKALLPSPSRGRLPQRSWHHDSASRPEPAHTTIPSRAAAANEPSAAPSFPQMHEQLIVDVQNLPGLSLDDPAPSSGSLEVPPRFFGPTPQNTPTVPIREYNRARRSAHSPTPGAHSRASYSGALVAPPPDQPQVPLADDYVEEYEGGLIAGAVEIMNTARDLLGALIGSSSDYGLSWYA
ncbi:protein phosphatase regulator [Malassezia sp. CBS 17886]|nr:protein phosphatase regulator [Malassezia sp. CBS 17886]